MPAERSLKTGPRLAPLTILPSPGLMAFVSNFCKREFENSFELIVYARSHEIGRRPFLAWMNFMRRGTVQQFLNSGQQIHLTAFS
jgi:hypothetical protein